jgi:hypothetical protein
MRILLFALVTLAACGKPPATLPLHFEAVDVRLVPAFERLAADLERTHGTPVIALDAKPGEGWTALVDTARVESEFGAHGGGFYDPATRQIFLKALDRYTTQAVLAHEVGHALGLDHTPGGIMAEGTHEMGGCLDTPADCLMQALTE